jgi:energy-coupling factor transporter ATP-binding protein EcfA2
MLATETAHERCRTEPFSCPTELDMYCTAWGSLAELAAAVSAASKAEAAAEAADPAVQQEWREWRALEAALMNGHKEQESEAADGRLRDAVSYPYLGNDRERKPDVVEDVLREGQVVIVAGEEGAGKSTLAHEIAHGMIVGEVLGGHKVEGVERVLIVDVEQPEEDALIIRDELVERGFKPNANVYWVDAVGRFFDREEDKTWLRELVRTVQPQVIILDTATEAVTKPRDDESVKHLFILFGSLVRNDGVRGVIFLGQARKRSQDAEGPRQFDDLFGSRVWKGRSSAIFWIEGDTFTVWKQRGSRLERRWGGRNGDRYASGRIVRHPDDPTELRGPLSTEERRRRICDVVTEHPDEYSKTSLIETHLRITGDVERNRWRKDVDALVADGVLVSKGRWNRLSLEPRG